MVEHSLAEAGTEMEPPRRVTLDYSLKNIPIPSRTSYLKRLIEKIESVVRRMRWRAYYYLQSGKGDHTEDEDDEYYGLKSEKSPPYVEELADFEEDMAKLIESVEFRNVRSKFQDALHNDIARIRRSNAVFVTADKTRNLYQVEKDQYQKLLRNNVTKHYQLADGRAYSDVNAETQVIAHKLRIADRLETMAKKEAYVTLKDHKDNFENALPCRLINPAKNEMGIVSKHILDGINKKLREKLDVTLWKNSTEVIEWFKCIEAKDDCTFISFDIVEYYPSISERLLERALDFAQQHVEISDDEICVIHNSRKSLLFSDDKTWIKKESKGMFDVTMGSHDGAEVCELVGMFALAQLPARYRKQNVGLYRDDGLAVSRGTSGSEAERVKKDLTKRFKDLGLRVTIDANLKITNFLDLTLNLRSGKYCPYRKPNDTPLYINRSSNHPPSILKNLPTAVSRRLTQISSDEEIFNEAAPLYDDALKISGYNDRLKYDEIWMKRSPHQRKKRSRERKITWFNPPFSRNVKTNVAQKFLKLVDKHFPQNSKLSKIFNRNTLKVSYSCMPNVATIIKRHNARVCADAKIASKPKQCNCRQPGQCPLKGECLTSSIVYRATVTTSETAMPRHYIGSTETTFKQRFNNHKASFKHADKANQTALSKYIWSLRNDGTDYQVNWEILMRAPAYSNKTKRCDLCVTEKLLIATADKKVLLNKRSELLSKCRHKNKHRISSFVRAPI